MALALIASRWARRGRGKVTVLTVDHRLRPGSGREARWVKERLGRRGIAHRILTWRDGSADGRGNLQARARAARYRLLADWCRRHGVLHLLTAHHRDDQAETFLLRLGRGSGLYGLAGIPEVNERPDMRILRPLLGAAKNDLCAYLEARGERWLDDPSNQDPVFARVRARRALPVIARAGIEPARIADAARRLGRDRVALEGAVARLLAEAAAPDPTGFVTLDRDRLLAAAPEVGKRALARVLVTVGGGAYAPRFERLERLFMEVRGACPARTLGGCQIRKRQDGALLVCREPGRQQGPVTVSAAGAIAWDGRFVVVLGRRRQASAGGTMTLGALGRGGWAAVKADPDGFVGRCQGRPRPLPLAVAIGLPALSDRRGVVEVPHLGYRRSRGAVASLTIKEIRHVPPEPLAGAGFGVCAAGAPE